jgi:hypothetical protein
VPTGRASGPHSHDECEPECLARGCAMDSDHAATCLGCSRGCGTRRAIGSAHDASPPAGSRASSSSHHLTVSPSPDCRQTVAQRMLYRCIINASSADVGRHLTKPCRSLEGVLAMPTCSIACDDVEGCSSVRRRASTDAAGVGRTRFDDGMMSATRSSTVLAGEIQQTFGLGVRFAQACAPEAVGGGHAKHGVGGAGSRGPAGTTRASYRNRTARR